MPWPPWVRQEPRVVVRAEGAGGQAPYQPEFRWREPSYEQTPSEAGNEHYERAK